MKTTPRKIHADVTSEGYSYNIRLYDAHGFELPAFVYEVRYNGETLLHDTAISKVYAVRDFINSLNDATLEAFYQPKINQ